MPELYRDDPYSWAQQQALALRRAESLRLNGPDGVDWANLATEIEALSASIERELFSRYRVLLIHLLKWRFQPSRRGRSWRGTIDEQRDALEHLLNQNPSLKARRAVNFDQAWISARRRALNESRLSANKLPLACPFTLEQVEDLDWLPEAPAPGDDHA